MAKNHDPILHHICGASPANNQILLFDGHNSHFNDGALRQMMCKNIQIFVIESSNSIKNQPNDNGPNAKLKSLYNVAKTTWVLKYETTKFSPHHMNSLLVEAWYDFKVSSVNTIRDSFAKTNIPPLIPPNLSTNTQSCDSSIQVSSGAKAEEINNISHQTVVPIELQVTRTEDPMVVLREKDKQKSSRNIILRATAYDAVRKLIVVPIQDMKK